MMSSSFTKLILVVSIIVVLALLAIGSQNAVSLDKTDTSTVNNATRLIIKFKSTTAVAQMTNQISEVLGQDVIYQRALAVEGHHLIRLTQPLSKSQLTDAINALMNESNIESVEEDKVLQHMMTPNGFNRGGSK